MIKTINTEMLTKMFLAGAKRLELKKDYINELNVFPVPDGDTGTNMSLTIMAASKEVAAIKNPTMANLAKAISSGSLRGARGNSGVIVSQLLRGFTKKIQEVDEIDAFILAAAFENAKEVAYKAVMKPKEGTILTVAKGLADKAVEMAYKTEDLEEFIPKVLEYGDYILSKTPEMLPMLKEAGVVDSGGQGLMEFLKGAYDAFLGKESSEVVAVESLTTQDSHEDIKVIRISEEAKKAIKYGYCTEFIVLLKKDFTPENEMEFKGFLESIGDSVVCVAMDDIVKVHVHTNNPGDAMQKALEYGQLSKLKIDNMREEYEERRLKDALK